MRLKADLHIHSVLSPCGDLEMSPTAIVDKAKQAGLDIIGITDHNSTLHAPLIKALGKEKGITVLMGAEVTTSEEIHCLCFMEDIDKLDQFQSFIDENILGIPNDPKKFGYQVVVNRNEEIIREIPQLLIQSTMISFDQLQSKVKELNGIFIPAHIDRSSYSLISQLGFIPFDTEVTAFEISKHANIEELQTSQPQLKESPIIRSSDAHFITDIGSGYSILEVENQDFSSIKHAISSNMIYL